MDPNQLSEGSSTSRSMNKRRHRCFCGEEMVVLLSSSFMNSPSRRFVACCKLPKCNFFEWIDRDKDVMGKGRRSHCFCGDLLTLRISSTVMNPNRRFISCPSRRCKFFEWFDEEDMAGAQSQCT
ncbi:DNA topoisomerase [Arachis hypogaea]|nr:DNA topoisomerase [Arachis hypogaea]